MDVAILGGGIAGLTLAKWLAEEGVDFVLLEEHQRFFHKACGEGFYEQMGEHSFTHLYESNRGIERRLEETAVSTPHGILTVRLPVLMTDKRAVEEELARQVRARGGIIRTGEKVEALERQGRATILWPQGIRSRVVVGADGARSLVRRHLGLPPLHLGIAAATRCPSVDLPDRMLHVEFKRSVIPCGYAWYFPKKECWNVGIGTYAPRYFKPCLASFKKRFSDNLSWAVDSLPIGRPQPAVHHTSLLVGDAAGQVFAATGSGNLPAMICATLAARTLSRAARHGFRTPDFSDYERAWRATLGKPFARSHRLRQLTHTAQISEHLFHLLLKTGIKMS